MPAPARPGPVKQTESTYRRIHKDYYDANLSDFPVLPHAFRPTKDDIGGISVVRVDFTQSPQDALIGVKPDKVNSYHVALVTVEEYLAQNLSVVEDAIIDKAGFPDNPGHALVPELNYARYKDESTKQSLLDKMTALARIAGRRLVHSPTPTPPPASPLA